MKVITLLRVSTKKQANTGHSLADQEANLQKYAEKLGATIIKTIKIQVSGSKMLMNQGVLMKALEEARSSEASLMVSALDRLSRDASTLFLLRKNAIEKGIEVFIAGIERSISSMNAIEFGVLSSFAEYERQKTIERTRNSTKKRSQGLLLEKLTQSKHQKFRPRKEEDSRTSGEIKLILSAKSKMQSAS